MSEDSEIFELEKKIQKLSNVVTHSINNLSITASELIKSLDDTPTPKTDKWSVASPSSNTNNPWKYLDIDSGFRNRTLYPNQSSFVVPFTNSAAGSNTFNSVEPVSLGLPYEAVVILSVLYDTPTGGSVTITTPTFNINNFFINSYLVTALQVKPLPQVTSYKVTTLANTLTYNHQLFPIVAETLSFSTEPPVLPYALISGTSTVNYIDIPPQTLYPLSNQVDFYKGMFILLNSPLLFGGIRVIQSYDPTLGRFFVSPPYDPAIIASFPVLAELAQFSYDNVKTLLYSGTLTNQAVCYDIQLIGIAIPNQVFGIPYGGIVDNYPYINVYINNTNSHEAQAIYSNLPIAIARKSTFKMYMSRQQASPGSFSVYLNQAVTATQTIKLLLNESLEIQVSLPDGQVLQFENPENPPPFPSNPLLQFHILFAVRRS